MVPFTQLTAARRKADPSKPPLGRWYFGSPILATVFDFFPKERKRERRREGGEKKKKRRRKEEEKKKRRKEEKKEREKKEGREKIDKEATFAQKIGSSKHYFGDHVRTLNCHY